MIKSMTGYGRGEAIENGLIAGVEIKSVNNRFCDISFRLPEALRSKESAVRDIIQSRVDRGKLNVTIRLEKQDGAELDITVDPKVARSYKKLLDDLKTATGLNKEVELQDLLHFSDIFTGKDEDDEVVEHHFVLVEKALKAALDQLNAMRAQEGNHLAEDLMQRITEIRNHLVTVEQKAGERIPEVRKKLTERISALLQDDQYDKARLELEITLMADKLDITEELVRLEAHLKFFEQAIKKGDAVGRKLNFLTQEMNREINTIGSKSNDAEIAHLAVEMKEILEKIREQVQNIE